MKKCRNCCDDVPPCDQTICITVLGCLDLPLGGAAVTVRKTSDSSLIDDCETPQYTTTPNGTCCIVRSNPGEPLDVTITVAADGFVTSISEHTLPDHCSTVTLTIELTPTGGIDPFEPGGTDDPCRFSADCLCGGVPINAPRIDFSTGGGGVMSYYDSGPPFFVRFFYYVHNTGVTVAADGGSHAEGPAYIMWTFGLCFAFPWDLTYTCVSGLLVSGDPEGPGETVCFDVIGSEENDIVSRSCDPWEDTLELVDDFVLDTFGGPVVIYPAGTVITIADDSV